LFLAPDRLGQNRPYQTAAEAGAQPAEALAASLTTVAGDAAKRRIDEFEQLKGQFSEAQAVLSRLGDAASGLAVILTSSAAQVENASKKLTSILDANKHQEFGAVTDSIKDRIGDTANLRRSPSENEQMRGYEKLAGTAYSKDPNDTFDEQIGGISRYAFELQRVNDLLDQLDRTEQFRAMSESIGSTMAGAIEDVVFQVGSLEDVMENMVRNVAKTIFNTLVTQQLASFFTGLVGGGFGLGGGGGGAKLFAKGGIINSPQFIGLAGGIPAIGGESGPEAVVPLPDGRRIPVQMRGGGGGGNVVVNMTVVTPNSDSFRRSERQVTSALSGQLRRRR